MENISNLNSANKHIQYLNCHNAEDFLAKLAGFSDEGAFLFTHLTQWL